MPHLARCARRAVLAAGVIVGASCHSPTENTTLAPLDGIYNAIAIDDSAGPIRLTADTLVDLAITSASLDLRFEHRAIFTTNMAHASDSTRPRVTYVMVFPYAVYGDSIGTDSVGIGGKRLATTLRFTMRYIVYPPGGAPTEMASHTFIFAR